LSGHVDIVLIILAAICFCLALLCFVKKAPDQTELASMKKPSTPRKWWVWIIYAVFIGANNLFWGYVSQWLDKPLYALNYKWFGRYNSSGDSILRWFTNSSEPGLVMLGRFFIPILGFLALAIAGHFILKQVDKRLYHQKPAAEELEPI
ncbi:MAG: hypothetical protein Q4C55_06895, partial [Eubacterium sp.]|nr:hypothetical protein [Eubacterium sp.]